MDQVRAVNDVARAAYTRGVADKASGTVRTADELASWLELECATVMEVATAPPKEGQLAAKLAIGVFWLGIAAPLVLKLWTWAL